MGIGEAEAEIRHTGMKFRELPDGLTFCVLTGSSHKADELRTITRLLNKKIAGVEILTPENAPDEPDWVRGAELITEKEQRLTKALSREGRRQLPGELWVAGDVNIAVGIAGDIWETARKPEASVTDEALPDYITGKFMKYPDNAVMTSRMEAASAWQVDRKTRPLVVVERGFAQLYPALVSNMKDPEYVKDYLGFCKEKYAQQLAQGLNTGATNRKAPWGVRWDDLYEFSRKNPRGGQEQMDLNIRTWQNQTQHEALSQLVRGFTPTDVQAAFGYIGTNFDSLISGLRSPQQPLMLFPGK